MLHRHFPIPLRRSSKRQSSASKVCALVMYPQLCKESDTAGSPECSSSICFFNNSAADCISLSGASPGGLIRRERAVARGAGRKGWTGLETRPLTSFSFPALYPTIQAVSFSTTAASCPSSSISRGNRFALI